MKDYCLTPVFQLWNWRNTSQVEIVLVSILLSELKHYPVVPVENTYIYYSSEGYIYMAWWMHKWETDNC